ncbi:MAG: hypothetical protein P4L53_05015 [Candidatus Obscuribacterales bacterium]|nr:hypothetical protein [Candidatus Obscuribacterales bacterium]
MKRSFTCLGAALCLTFLSPVIQKASAQSISCNSIDGTTSTQWPNGVTANACGATTSAAEMQWLLQQIDATQTDVAIRLEGVQVGAGTVSVQITDSSIPGGTETVSYAAKASDSVATIINNLSKAVSNDSNLSAASIYASGYGKNLNIYSYSGNTTTYSANIGTTGLTYTLASSGGSNESLSLDGTRGGFPFFAWANITDYKSLPHPSGGPSEYGTPGAADLGLTVNDLTNGVSWGSIFDTASDGSTSDVMFHVTAHELGHQVDLLYAKQGVVVSQNGQLGGTPSAGDTITITVTDPAISGSPISVVYTVTGTDTLSTITSGLVNLVNSTATLTAVGINAGVNKQSLYQVNLTSPTGSGTTFTSSVAGTGGNSPTETFDIGAANHFVSSSGAFKIAYDLDVAFVNLAHPCSVPFTSHADPTVSGYGAGIFTGVIDVTGAYICTGTNNDTLSGTYTGLTDNMAILQKAFPLSKTEHNFEIFAEMFAADLGFADTTYSYTTQLNRPTGSDSIFSRTFACTADYVAQLVYGGAPTNSSEAGNTNFYDDGSDHYTKYLCDGSVTDGYQGAAPSIIKRP